MPHEHACSICGAVPAPFGYGFPGHRRLLPMAQRGRLWSCAGCQPQAEARWRGATQTRRMILAAKARQARDNRQSKLASTCEAELRAVTLECLRRGL